MSTLMKKFRSRWRVPITRRFAAVSLAAFTVGLVLPPPDAIAQDLGFCPSNGQVIVFYGGEAYYGTAVRQPESWDEGWFSDSYTFTATSADGDMLWGEFSLSEAKCAAAGETGGWTSADDYVIEGYSSGGMV